MRGQTHLDETAQNLSIFLRVIRTSFVKNRFPDVRDGDVLRVGEYQSEDIVRVPVKEVLDLAQVGLYCSTVEQSLI